MSGKEYYYTLFKEYIEKQVKSTQEQLKGLEYNIRIRKIYKELQSKNSNKFIEYYGVLSQISEYIKDNLDVIDFLVKNNITSAPQMREAIENILADKDLLQLISFTESKELLEGKIQKLTSILDGTCDFEILKNALLDSDLNDECVIGILDAEAEKTVKPEKKKLPSLDNNNAINKEVMSKYNETIKKINKLVTRYYHLIQNKPSNLIEMYRKTLMGTNMKEINEVYQEKDVLVCLHILHLIDLKTEGEEVLNIKPVDYSLLEINIEELESAYEDATLIVEKYEKEQQEMVPQESTMYFLLDENNKLLFNLDSFSEDERRSISSILSDLEMGLFDYERNKSNHTIVKQSIRKDLNVFVNRKRNVAVSYIRINSEELEGSKVLVLSIEDIKKIFATSQSILRSNSKLVDDSISKVKENTEEYNALQASIKDEIDSSFQREEVTHHE